MHVNVNQDKSELLCSSRVNSLPWAQSTFLLLSTLKMLQSVGTSVAPQAVIDLIRTTHAVRCFMPKFCDLSLKSWSSRVGLQSSTFCVRELASAARVFADATFAWGCVLLLGCRFRSSELSLDSPLGFQLGLCDVTRAVSPHSNPLVVVFSAVCHDPREIMTAP
jgi:hypothetical protein